MKKLILGATVLFIVLVSVSLFAEDAGKVSPVGVAVKGSFSFGDFKPVTGADPFESAGKLKQSIVPGGEIIFLPGRRVSFGAEVLGGLKTQPRVYQQEFYDLAVSGKMNLAVLGNVYLNLATKGRVRPYVVGGYGLGFAETSYISSNIHLPPGITPQWDLNNVLKSNVHIVKAGVGASIFAARHVAFTVEAGYRNGGYASIGVRFQ